MVLAAARPHPLRPVTAKPAVGATSSVTTALRGQPLAAQAHVLKPRPAAPAAGTLKAVDAQSDIAKRHPASPTDQAAVTNGATDPTVALKHPLFPTFKARVAALFAEYPPAPGTDIAATTEATWLLVCDAMVKSSADMAQNASPSAYSNAQKRWVDYASPAFQKAMSHFDVVMKSLKAASAGQFTKAKSFGFWSKAEAKKLAESSCDLTLETSGIGALFDGLGTLDKLNSWDMQLWGSLSQAYAQAIFETWKRPGRSVNVFTGFGTDKSNIFGQIESLAVRAGARNIGKTMEEVTTFHAVAVKAQAASDKQRDIDFSVKDGALPGTWHSGRDWDHALKVGRIRYNHLPVKGATP